MKYYLQRNLIKFTVKKKKLNDQPINTKCKKIQMLIYFKNNRTTKTEQKILKYGY